jgi:hypothetical protein
VRRPGLLIAAGVAAGVLAVALAMAAVSRVGNQVTGDRPAPLSAEQVREELAVETSTSSPGTTSTVAPGETTTSTTIAPPTTAAAPTTLAPPTTLSPSETRTYPLRGGTATLRFSPAGVTVVVANPNPGYSVEVEPTHGNGVEVSFEGDGRRSKVEAWWDGGPREQVDETTEADD